MELYDKHFWFMEFNSGYVEYNILHATEYFQVYPAFSA